MRGPFTRSMVHGPQRTDSVVVFLGRKRITSMAAVLCALVLGGCGGSDPRLTALQGDPIAKATFAHTTLDHEFTKKSGTSMGKPVHAEVTREFTFSGVTAQSLFEQAVALAEQYGWKQQFRQGTGYIGTKEIGDVSASLGIHVGGPSGASTFVIDLTAN
jgi:hypothetical protein